MQIKNVRDPNQKEKNNIIPKLILLGVTTSIVTSIVYLMNFYPMNIKESMYLAGKIASTKTAAQHDIIIKVFETIYGRDYMLNKLEGIPVSALISIIAEATCGIIYKIQTTVKGLR